MTLLYSASFVLFTLAAATCWFRRYRRLRIGLLLCMVVAFAAVAGRLGFVLTHLDAYAGAPWSVLDLRDGGVAPVAALLAAFASAAEGTRRAPWLRKPLATALAGGAGAWALAAMLAPFLAGPMQVPAIVLRQLDGTAVTLSRFRGQALVLNLWASWCPPCRREMPLLAEAQRTHPGVQFVFVNQGEELPVIERYLQAQQLALRNVFADRLGQAAGATNSIGMPTTLFFNDRGELVGRHVGEIDPASLERSLAALQRPADPAGRR